MGKQVKCAGPDGPWCPSLDGRLQDVNARTRGLAALELTTFSTGAKRVVGVYYRTGAKDPGLLLNFCPWCGADIQPREAKQRVSAPEVAS